MERREPKHKRNQTQQSNDAAKKKEKEKTEKKSVQPRKTVSQQMLPRGKNP
jgi:hypothetical protein